MGGRKKRYLSPHPANTWLRFSSDFLQMVGACAYSYGAAQLQTLYEQRGDVFLDFADVTWGEHDKTFTVFTCGTPPLRLAYNFPSMSQFPFQRTEFAVVAHIRARYHLSDHLNGRDILDWACSSDGQSAFLKSFPMAVPR